MKTGWSAPRFPAGGSEEAHPLETVALWLLGGLVAAGVLLWMTGQVSGRLFGGAWPPMPASQIGSVVLDYPHHVSDPADAWPQRARDLIPGPVAFYGTAAALVLPALAAVALLSIHRRNRRSDARSARWAHRRDLRQLRKRGRDIGRLSLGRVGGQLVAAEPRQSVIVIGPTQTGKTTGFAIPAILEWQGPVVATSVKTDLLRETLTARSSRPDAKTWIYDPTASTGLPGAGWTPLVQCLSWQGAQRTADWLVRAARPGNTANEAAADFWYGATAKVLAPILLAAACSGGTMAQVVQWVDGQEDEPVRFALEANGEEEAVTAFEAISLWDERSRGSVYATAQTVLVAYTDPGVLASAMTAELRAERLLDGGCHTAYLCAPSHEQRRLQPLFATLVQEIVAHAYERTTETGKPLDPPLLLVLDECANIAPLRDLATLASTGAGQGIQLVSV
ncbi:MAG: type IV secretory system conjugative DNA transfer family protein, partial [Geminicoccales bacterium]